MAKIKIKSFDNEKEEFDWLAKNQSLLKAQRKSEPKKTDGHGFGFTSFAIDERGEQMKADAIAQTPDFQSGILKVRCVINATNILDSHRDLHLPGIWKKSLSENKLIYLCQEHSLTFEGIISDEVKAFTKNYSFVELGFPYEGNSECLIFDAIIRKDRNEYMFNQYAKGFVRNHSVRMEYVKEYFCMNSEDTDHANYKENYDKFSGLCANKDDMANVSWFYAITEAKIRDEGSAVVKGSCFATPTLEITPKNIDQAEESLDKSEPFSDTQTRKKVFIN